MNVADNTPGVLLIQSESPVPVLPEAQPDPCLEIACLVHDQNNLIQQALFKLYKLHLHLCNDPFNQRVVEDLARIQEDLQAMNQQTLERFHGHASIVEETQIEPFSVLRGILKDVPNLKGTPMYAYFPSFEKRVPIRRVDLKRVTVNLLVNALQAVPEEGGNVQVTAGYEAYGGRNRDRRDSVLRITVADNGPGISKDMQRRLFAPGVTTRSSGHGLGLFGAREILSRYGGRLSFRSTPGLGTRVTAFWPIAPVLESLE